MILSSSVKLKVYEIANDLKVNPEDLIKLIDFESSWNPQAKNPYSSARGLIQFVDSTAKNLGFLDSLDLVTQHPTIIDQLQIVYEYLSMYYPFRDKQDLYMSVFYPAYRRKDPQTEFPKNVQMSNPGIRTIQDYVNLVERGSGNGKTGALIIVSIALVLFYLLKGRK